MNDRIQIEKAANGWIVRPAPDFSRDTMVPVTSLMLFTEMEALLSYIAEEMQLKAKK